MLKKLPGSEALEILKQHINYNPETGKISGVTEHTSGDYLRIYVLGEYIYSHVVAALFMTGEWPVADVDHDNHKKKDNRWDNLEPVSKAVNSQRRKIPGAGVSWHKASKSWVSYVYRNNKRIQIRSSQDKQVAVDARTQWLERNK